MTAVTAVTAQNTKGVSAVFPMKPKEIGKQILFTCKNIKPNGIKIGMLHSSQVIKSVASALKQVKVSKIVLDPVMVAKGGARLINKSAIKTLKAEVPNTQSGYASTQSRFANSKLIQNLGSSNFGVQFSFVSDLRTAYGRD